MRKMFFIIVLLLLNSIAYAVEYPDLNKYYPLEVGYEWIYSTQIAGLERHIVELYDNSESAYVIRTQNNIVTLMSAVQKLGDRVSTVIVQNGFTEELSRLIPPRIIMTAPLKKGAKWENLEKDNLEKFKVIGFVDMEVKAGKFSNVLKVERTINTKKNKKWPTTYKYYAPGVGLIKEEVISKDKPPFIMKELVDYKITVQ